MDKRKFNRGTIGNKGGRPSKAEELKLIEKLKPMEDLAHQKLTEALKNGKDWAIKLFFEYMYGKPKQPIDANVQSEVMQTIIERNIVKSA